MYAYPAAKGCCDIVGHFSHVAAAVMAGCQIQAASDIGWYETFLDEDINVLPFCYLERTRIVHFQSVFVFADHMNTPFS
jgi:hypothetical protein